MPTIVVYRERAYRDILLEKFQKSGIDARVFFWPLSSMRMFAKQTGNKNSYWVQKRAINLPSFHDMTDEDQERVAMVVKEALSE
jgi:perosamine synthetase